MKIKSIPLVGVKAGEADGLAEGEFLVYPSTFTRVPDAYGDVVAKGAFVDGIQAWKESGDVMPGMYLHDPNQIVASAIDMGEDETGWWVKGAFDDDPASQRIYRLLKGRRLSSLSFAYDTLAEGSVTLDDGQKANELRKLMPHEFSFLPKGFAANEDTSVVAVKAATDSILSGFKAGRVLAQKHIDSLRNAQEAIGAVIAAAEAEQDQGKAAGQAVVKDEGAARVKSEDPSVNPSAIDTWQRSIKEGPIGPDGVFIITVNPEEGTK